MQSIFAFEQCKKANYNLALDLISDAFKPDLNSMEVQNKSLLKTQGKEALSLFNQHYDDQSLPKDGSKEAKILDVVNSAIDKYHAEVLKDREYLRKTMLRDAETIIDRFIWLLEVPNIIKDLANQEKSRKMLPPLNHFLENRVLVSLKNNKQVKKRSEKSKLSWSPYEEELKIWLREIIYKDDIFLSYLKEESSDFQSDKELVQHLFKGVIFKHEIIRQFMEKIDLYWSENEAIIKSMVSKTVKGIDSEDGKFDLAELSYNWEDDKVFFNTIFEKTLIHEKEYEALIGKKASNWDIDRMAGTDKILLEMAIQEMINFSAIPIKVTINEYIEISKRYSTPKSKQFVNGVLDVIALDLQKRGLIKKSGRGLIDNK